MKTAFITGANQGLGIGFVTYLAEEGWKVYATTRKSTDDLVAHDNVRWIQLELTSDTSISEAFKTVSAEVDAVDLLINNAGVNKDTATGSRKEKVSTLGSLDRNMLNDMFNINAVSPLMLTQTFLPLLKSKPSFVINLSSCRASYNDEFDNRLGNYGYRASKIALNMFTFCSVIDLPETVKTFAVHPGTVKSQMNVTGDQEPYSQAKEIIKITENWNDEWNGKFMRYDGSLYPL